MRSMTNTPSADALPPELRAEVCANDRIMHYRRSGAGLPILLMFAAPATTPLTDELTRVLATKFRLIVPEMPLGINPTDWIAEFLEGIGLTAVTLIAAGPFCMAAIELALRDDDQVSRLALIPDGEADDSMHDEAVLTTFGPAQIPAIIVRPDLEARDSAAIIMRFVEDGANGKG